MIRGEDEVQRQVQLDPTGRMQVVKGVQKKILEPNKFSEEQTGSELLTHRDIQIAARTQEQTPATIYNAKLDARWHENRTDSSPGALGLKRIGISMSLIDLASSHWFVFRGTTVLMTILIGALVQQIYRKSASPIAFAAISCMFFGMDNFFIAYAGSYLRAPSAHMALTFLFIGVIALILHVVLVLTYAPYKSQIQAMLGSTKMVLTCIPLTAIFVVIAEVCACIGYSFDLPASGPYQALASCNVLIVGPFFYYFEGERMTRLQLGGMLVMVIGAFSMSEISKWEAPHSETLHGFLWLTLSMILYSASDITLRFTSLVGLHWVPRVLLMLFTMGVLGFPMSAINHHDDGFMEFRNEPSLLVWPFLNALAGILGLLSCTIAFEAPEAPCGVLTAIVNANSVVLVVMNKVILGYEPSLSKLIGVGLIMVGVCTFHASQKD